MQRIVALFFEGFVFARAFFEFLDRMEIILRESHHWIGGEWAQIWSDESKLEFFPEIFAINYKMTITHEKEDIHKNHFSIIFRLC